MPQQNSEKNHHINKRLSNLASATRALRIVFVLAPFVIFCVHSKNGALRGILLSKGEQPLSPTLISWKGRLMNLYMIEKLLCSRGREICGELQGGFIPSVQISISLLHTNL